MYTSEGLLFRQLGAHERRDAAFLEAFFLIESAARNNEGAMLYDDQARPSLIGTVAVAILDSYDEEIAGSILYDAEPDGNALWLETVAIHPDYRGNGIGREAMTYVEECARDRSCTEVRLNAQPNPRTLNFYRRLGYNTIETMRSKRYVSMSKSV